MCLFFFLPPLLSDCGPTDQENTTTTTKKDTAFCLSIEQVDIHALFQNNVNQFIVDIRRGKRERDELRTIGKNILMLLLSDQSVKVKFHQITICIH
jgi:hypothetical protein